MKGLYGLTFRIQFESNQPHFIALCYPYLYSDLQQQISRLTLGTDTRVRREVLCRTLAGHSCDMLTFGDFTHDQFEMMRRPCIVVVGRVHPGETNASWIVTGLMRFLASDHPSAVHLRENAVVKVVPMLNPDGVINVCPKRF